MHKFGKTCDCVLPLTDPNACKKCSNSPPLNTVVMYKSLAFTKFMWLLDVVNLFKVSTRYTPNNLMEFMSKSKSEFEKDLK